MVMATSAFGSDGATAVAVEQPGTDRSVALPAATAADRCEGPWSAIFCDVRAAAHGQIATAVPAANGRRTRTCYAIPGTTNVADHKAIVLIVTDEHAYPWSDQKFLLGVQYADDRNLAARQSIYAFRQPRVDFPAQVIDVVRPGGQEVVADVGCGNGGYLAELARRGHQGPVLGVDLSPGMLHAARARAVRLPAACLLAGDASRLPFRSGFSDLTLAMHMLYHVPEPAAAVSELRRVTRPGGTVVIGLNGDDHLRELRDLIGAALADAGHRQVRVPGEKLRLNQGEELAARVFGSVVRLDFTGELLLPGPQPVADYARSLSLTASAAEADRLASAVAARLDYGDDGFFRVRTHAGCLICA